VVAVAAPPVVVGVHRAGANNEGNPALGRPRGWVDHHKVLALEDGPVVVAHPHHHQIEPCAPAGGNLQPKGHRPVAAHHMGVDGGGCRLGRDVVAGEDQLRLGAFACDLKLESGPGAVHVEVDRVARPVAVAGCISPDLGNRRIIERFFVGPVVAAVTVGRGPGARNHPRLVEDRGAVVQRTMVAVGGHRAGRGW